MLLINNVYESAGQNSMYNSEILQPLLVHYKFQSTDIWDITVHIRPGHLFPHAESLLSCMWNTWVNASNGGCNLILFVQFNDWDELLEIIRADEEESLSLLQCTAVSELYAVWIKPTCKMVKCKCSLPFKSHHLPQPETISFCSDNEKQLDVKWRPAGWAAQHQHYSKRLLWNVFPPDHSMPGPGPDGESTCMFVTKTDLSFICWGQFWQKNWTVYTFTSNSAGWEYLVTLLYPICWRLPNGWQFQFWLILLISHTKTQ